MNRLLSLTCFACTALATELALAQGVPGAAPPAADEPLAPAAEEPPPAAAAPSQPENAPRPPAAAPAPQPMPPMGPPAQSPWAPRAAQSPVQDTKPAEPLPPAEPPRWMAWLGLRTGFVNNKGYDPFAENDMLAQGSLGVSRSLFTMKPLSFAAALSFEGGGRSSTARGEATTLQTYRLMLGPEARWHLIPELYLFARPSAGVLRTVASLDEGSTGTTLYARDWLLAVDATAGAAFAFWDLRGKNQDFRMWIVVDGGYGWAQGSDLALAPDEASGAPQRTASLDLGELAVRGPFFRGALAASF